MIKDYNVPLDTKQRIKIREAIESHNSLAEITRELTTYRVVEYLLEDKPSLERYLTTMTGLLTKQRKQVSYSALIKSIFHARMHLPQYNKDFLAILTKVFDRERDIQFRVFVEENHLQATINNDLWKIYERHGDALRLNSMDFTTIQCVSLRYELKYYHRYLIEFSGKAAISLFHSQVLSLNALTEINPRIKYFSDITEADARALLMFLENVCGKKSGVPLSQNYIALAVGGIRRVIEYLMSDRRNNEIKALKPYINPFANLVFHNTNDFSTPTPTIPEDIIEKINSHSEELAPLYKLIYDIFANTGLRLKEVFFLEADCIESSRYSGICQLKFKPYKTLAARRRHNAGDYHRVMITKDLADKIFQHISDTAIDREAAKSKYIFLSRKPRCETVVMDSHPFIKDLRNIIEKYDIRDENGELWHFTTKQFRKTVAVTLIENGATTAELAYWLGHMCSSTAARYYVEVRKMKLVELNTRFFKEKFDLILSGEQLEEYTEEERRLLYMDFRLEQRRVELGYCLLKIADGRCSNRISLYNCVNCKNLCTGMKYLPHWNELLIQQEMVIKTLVQTYHNNGIEDYTGFVEYKQEFHLLRGYENIVAAIKEGVGLSNDRSSHI